MFNWRTRRTHFDSIKYVGLVCVFSCYIQVDCYLTDDDTPTCTKFTFYSKAMMSPDAHTHTTRTHTNTTPCVQRKTCQITYLHIRQATRVCKLVYCIYLAKFMSKLGCTICSLLILFIVVFLTFIFFSNQILTLNMNKLATACQCRLMINLHNSSRFYCWFSAPLPQHQ